MVDFRALVNNRPQPRPVADLRQAIASDIWDGWNPNTANPALKGALTRVANAPVSTSWWDGIKTGIFDAINSSVGQGILNTLDAPRNAVFNQFDNWTDGEWNMNDILSPTSIAEGMVKSYQEGGKVETDTFLTKAGWENQDGWQSGWSAPAVVDNIRDIGSVVGNVLGDPLTYMTFGAGSAVKAAAGASAKEAAEQALQVGLRAGLQPGSPQLARFVDDTLTNAATAQARNQMVGFNVPFGPEVSVMNKPSFLKVNSQTIGDIPAQDLAKRMTDIGLTPDERYSFLSNLLQRPITSTKQINTQEFDHTWKLLNNGLDRAMTSTKNRQIDELLNTQPTSILDDINVAHGMPAAPVAAGANLLDALATKAGQSFSYFEGADGMSQLGQAIKGNPVSEAIGNAIGGRRYVAPSVAATDHRIPQAVNALEDGRLAGYANARAKIDDIAALANDDTLKMLSPEEMNMMPYVIEGQWPKSIDPTQIAPESMAVMDNAAVALKEYRDTFTKEELDAGIGYAQRDNYFPHILDIPSNPEEFGAFITQLKAVAPDLATQIENAPKGFTRSRKAFDSMAQLRDFLDDNAGNETIQKLLGNAVFNPIEAYGRRAMQGAQEVAKRQSYAEMQRIGVARQIKPGESIPKGWAKIDIPGLEDSVVPKEVHDRLTSLNKIMTNDKMLNKLASKADEMYTIWRRNATVTSPGFHVRQVIGNVFQNALAGVTPGSYTKAISVMNGGSVKIGGQNLPADTIIKEAMQDGVIGTGTSADYLNSLAREMGAQTTKGNPLQLANPLSEKFVLGTAGRKVGEKVDDVSRLAHYIFARNKGASRRIAKESVIKHLFDYSNITNVERGLRAVFPFYTWMRNNIPFQIAQAVKRPGLYQVIGDLQTVMQQEPEVDPLLDELGINRPDHRELMQGLVDENGGVLPDYIQEKYISMGGDNYFNLGLPASDLNTLDKPGEMIFQSLNPLLQWGKGLMSNENTFGAPIDKYSEDLSLMSPEGLRFTLDQFGGFPGRTIGNYLPDSAGNTRVGDQSILQQLGKLLGITQVDPAQALQGLLYDADRKAQSEKRRQKDMEK